MCARGVSDSFSSGGFSNQLFSLWEGVLTIGNIEEMSFQTCLSCLGQHLVTVCFAR